MPQFLRLLPGGLRFFLLHRRLLDSLHGNQAGANVLFGLAPLFPVKSGVKLILPLQCVEVFLLGEVTGFLLSICQTGSPQLGLQQNAFFLKAGIFLCHGLRLVLLMQSFLPGFLCLKLGLLQLLPGLCHFLLVQLPRLLNLLFLLLVQRQHMLFVECVPLLQSLLAHLLRLQILFQQNLAFLPALLQLLVHGSLCLPGGK